MVVSGVIVVIFDVNPMGPQISYVMFFISRWYSSDTRTSYSSDIKQKKWDAYLIWDLVNCTDLQAHTTK